MRNSLSMVGAIALSTAALLGQQVTLPAIFATTEGGTSGNIWRLGPNRVQCIYDSTNFTTQGVLAPIQITSVEWRLAGAGVTNIETYPQVGIYLQPSATDYATPNLQFDLNRTVAFPTTPNFTGPVTTVAVSGTTPNDYFITIPLSTPFNFDPSLGQDLLLEIEIPTAPTPALGNVISTAFNVAAHLCNSVRSVGSTTAVTGAASAFCPVARFNYTPVPGAAVNTPLGTGCVKKFTSFYELFALPINFDLNNTALSIVPTGTGSYAVSTGGGFLPIGSVATPVALTLGDDAEVVQTFTVGSFAGPTGLAWPSINVISNGAVSETTGHPTAVAGGGAPDVTIDLNAASTTFYGALADWDPSATGGGNVWWEESVGVTTITWDNVPNWTTTGPGLPNTFQIQLYPSGLVVVAWTNVQSFGNNGGVLVGYSPGGASEIPPARDLSAIGGGFVTDVADVRGLTLSGLTRPVLNTAWSLQVSEIPATGVFGLDIFGTSDPGINDLFLQTFGIINAPTCGLRASLDTILGPWFVSGTTHNYGFTVPNVPSLVGFNVYTTSAVFEAPPQNGFGAITANGIEGRVGSI